MYYTVYICIYSYICTMCIYMCIILYIYVYYTVYICVYSYICIYIYISTACIYIYAERERGKNDYLKCWSRESQSWERRWREMERSRERRWRWREEVCPWEKEEEEEERNMSALIQIYSAFRLVFSKHEFSSKLVFSKHESSSKLVFSKHEFQVWSSNLKSCFEITISINRVFKTRKQISNFELVFWKHENMVLLFFFKTPWFW